MTITDEARAECEALADRADGVEFHGNRFTYGGREDRNWLPAEDDEHLRRLYRIARDVVLKVEAGLPGVAWVGGTQRPYRGRTNTAVVLNAADEEQARRAVQPHGEPAPEDWAAARITDVEQFDGGWLVTLHYPYTD